MQVWAAVYFYAVIGVAVSLVFFNSPGKGVLRKRLNQRAKAAGMTTPRGHAPALEKNVGELEELLPGQTRENMRGPHLGLPEDPGADLDEVMDDIRKEVEFRRSRGQSLGQGLQEAVNNKVGELRKTGTEQGHAVANHLDGVLDNVKLDKLKKTK